MEGILQYIDDGGGRRRVEWAAPSGFLVVLIRRLLLLFSSPACQRYEPRECHDEEKCHHRRSNRAGRLNDGAVGKSHFYS